MCLAFGVSGWKNQAPLVSLLIMRLAMSSSAVASEHAATPASKNAQHFMRSPCFRYQFFRYVSKKFMVRLQASFAAGSL